MPPKRKNSQLSLGDDSQPPKKLSKAETKALNQQKGQALAAAKKLKKATLAAAANETLASTASATSTTTLPPATGPTARRLRGGEILPPPLAVVKERAKPTCSKCGQLKKGHTCLAVGATAARKVNFAATADDDAAKMLDSLVPLDHDSLQGAGDETGDVPPASPKITTDSPPPPLETEETTGAPMDAELDGKASEEAKALVDELTGDDRPFELLDSGAKDGGAGSRGASDGDATSDDDDDDATSDHETGEDKPSSSKKGKGNKTSKTARPSKVKDDSGLPNRLFKYSVTFKPKGEPTDGPREFTTTEFKVPRDCKIAQPYTEKQRKKRIPDGWKSAVNRVQVFAESLPGYTVLMHRAYDASPWIRVFWNDTLHAVAEPSEFSVSCVTRDDDCRPIEGQRSDVAIPQIVQDLVAEFCDATDPLIKKQAQSAAGTISSLAQQNHSLASQLDTQKEAAAALARENAAEKEAAAVLARENAELKRLLAEKNAAAE